MPKYLHNLHFRPGRTVTSLSRGSSVTQGTTEALVLPFSHSVFLRVIVEDTVKEKGWLRARRSEGISGVVRNTRASGDYYHGSIWFEV